MKQISSEDLVSGAICLVSLEGDDAKYRGEILEISENDQISVKYMDFGDTSQLASSEVRKGHSLKKNLRMNFL